MSGRMSISKLKEHPKNNHYFTDIEGAKYDEVKKSIKVNGIRDPIKCTTAYTVISGHQRLKIAKELGFTEVPVSIVDVDEWEAEYLLIAENVERRGQAESDPIKKSRIANFLKEFWGVGHGGSRGQNDPLKKTNKDIGVFIDEEERSTKRILKLNDLIPEIQHLVSSGNLGTTAAEQYAHIPPENQKILIDSLGEELGKKTVAESKDIRKESESVDFEKSLKEMILRLEKAEEERKQAVQQALLAQKSEEILQRQLEDEQNKRSEIIEKVIEVDKTDYILIEENKRRAKEAEEIAARAVRIQETAELEASIYKDKAIKYDEQNKNIEFATEERGSSGRYARGILKTSNLIVDIDEIVKKFAEIIHSQDCEDAKNDPIFQENMHNGINNLEKILSDTRKFMGGNGSRNGERVIIDGEFVESELI